MAKNPTRKVKSDAINDTSITQQGVSQILSALGFNLLPKHFTLEIEHSIRTIPFRGNLAYLSAICALARSADVGFIDYRLEHEAQPTLLAPEIVAENIIFCLRFGSDFLLNESPPAHIAVVSQRMDRLIDSTKALLKSQTGTPVGEIMCNKPTCGGHFLHGPWNSARVAQNDALRDVYSLMRFYINQPEQSPKHETRTTNTPVVLWEGAAHSDRNVRLARTRSAYLEAHGKVSEAMAKLEAQGHKIGRSTFYEHLEELDSECPGWRSRLQIPDHPEIR